MSKLCLEKKGKNKHPPEFPDEQVRDPLDEEAAVFVNNVLIDRDIDGTLTKNVGKENSYGNTEYKVTIMDRTKEKLKHLTTQLNFRLNEGDGQAIYGIGIEDNGNPIGITNEHLVGSLSK